MKLVDLHPRWTADYDILIGGHVVHDENRKGMGISFNCPHCVRAGNTSPTRLGVFFLNPVDGKPHTDDQDLQHLWTRSGATFEDLTLSPSIDARQYGHWHGFIQNGQVT
jgi:hypothetical protein